MKKYLFILTILLTTSFANAQSQTWYQSFFDKITNLLNETRKENLSNEARLQQYENAKQLIQNEIDKLKACNQVNVTVNNSNNSLIPYTFDRLSTPGAIQKTDPKTGIEYWLYPQISGEAPLTIKFKTEGGWTITYGDGTDNNSLREGSFSQDMGWQFTQGQITHTYNKPGTYTAIASAFMPSGKRAEVKIIVKDDTKRASTTCQKISQTLWEGNANQTIVDVSILQNFLDSKYEPEYRAGIYSKQDGNGVYGWRTKKLVETFQISNKIKATGNVGPQTLAKINSMISN